MAAEQGSSRQHPGGDAAPAPIRIIAVDDHPAIREAIRDSLLPYPDLVFAGEASDSEEAMRLARETQPHVAIVDLSLLDAHGLDLVHRMHLHFPSMRIIVFSMHGEDVYAERALRAGASGYVMKSEPTWNIVDAVRTVARGDIYLSHRMTAMIISKVVQRNEAGYGQPHAIDQLTDREIAVFRLLGRGESIEAISEKLQLSRKTVETYRRRAKEKLGFTSVSGLLHFAVQWIQAHKEAQV